MVAHTFNCSTWEAEGVDLCEFEASLVYRGSASMVRGVAQRNPVPNKQNKTKRIYFVLKLHLGDGVMYK